MPIEVHCPNPDCARVHLVKNKYGGMRGKCPACGGWMLVPSTGETPSVVGLPPPDLEEIAAFRQANRVPAASAPMGVPAMAGAALSGSSGLEDERAGPQLPLRQEQDNRAARDEEDEDVESPAATKPLSRTATFLLLLGVVCLAAVALTPFLDAGKVVATEDFVKDYGALRVEGIKEDQRLQVLAVPAGVAVLALLSLAAALVTGRFGLPSLLLLYATTLLSAGLLFLVLFVFHNETSVKDQFDRDVAQRQAAGQRGEASYPLGPYLWAGLGGAWGASLAFLLAGVVMHRRWWSRMLGFLFLAAAPSLAAVWVYRMELGIQGIQNYLSF